MLTFVQRDLRRQLIIRLARIRMRRHRPEIIGLTIAGAIGGAIGIGVAMTTLMAVGSLTTFGPRNILVNVAFTAMLVFALMGVFIGASIGLAASAGSTLAFRRPWLGTVLGVILGGAASFVLLIAPLGLMTIGFAGASVLLVGGVALFGAAIGLGAVLPSLLKLPWWVGVVSGALGGAVGITIAGLAGFPLFSMAPQPTVPAPLVLLAGAWMGLWIAFYIQRREHAVCYLARILPAVPVTTLPSLS